MIRFRFMILFFVFDYAAIPVDFVMIFTNHGAKIRQFTYMHKKLCCKICKECCNATIMPLFATFVLSPQTTFLYKQPQKTSTRSARRKILRVIIREPIQSGSKFQLIAGLQSFGASPPSTIFGRSLPTTAAATAPTAHASRCEITRQIAQISFC